MADGKIDHLIINSPYREPESYWKYDRESRSFIRTAGRRPAGYVRATEGSKAFDDPGVFVEIALVNQIRPRVKRWREEGYPGITGTTKRLLEHWKDPEARQGRQFFFCQIEAMETFIWLAEAPDSERVGIEIPSDGSQFGRLCSMMATGSGKTVVMAMLVAWQVLNKVAAPHDTRFSKNVLVVAPGHTVRRRLRVLVPTGPGNFYEDFDIVPMALQESLHQGTVRITNWHTLQWDSAEELAKRHSVDKRGPKSDEAYARETLAELASARNIMVINDEAHHAWRLTTADEGKDIDKAEVEEAKIWLAGLDRIAKSRGILCSYDFSATPFIPSGKKSTEESLFGWIVSCFGLNDAIESGLVKTPRVVVRDDGRYGKDFKSRLYHIYNDSEVRDDLNRRAEENTPLPDLVTNGYYLLGQDWLETLRAWKKAGQPTPPVMITVANRTETAARVKYAFDHRKIRIDELSSPDRTIHIDSRVLERIDAEDEGEAATLESTESPSDDEEEGPRLSKKDEEERLRRIVDTVGRIGEPGEQVQNVISVGMLSEGWDARTVTHIMGLRAFTSQLLCEQVIGRGLRRLSYELRDGSELLDPEYVNIFGVPFTFLPHETHDGPPPPPPAPRTKIEPLPERVEFEIKWPNVLRFDRTYHPKLTLDLAKVKTLPLNAANNATLAELAPIVDGKPDVSKLSEIDLIDLEKKFRMQRLVFAAAGEVFEQMKTEWTGPRDQLLAQLVQLVESFLTSDRIRITPKVYADDDARRRILLTLNMNRIVQHVQEAIVFENTESLEPVFDRERPVRSTADMPSWYTGKACERTKKSQVNFCVYDSRWEATEAFHLDRSPHVKAWVKNDHLGFEVFYVWEGVVHRYWPDFIVKLEDDTFLVLEVKGIDSQQNQTKRRFLDEWVSAVNAHGGFGFWQWAVSRNPSNVADVIAKAVAASGARAKRTRQIHGGTRPETSGELRLGGQTMIGTRGLKGTAKLRNWAKVDKGAEET
jgi:type III restriction enzyme